MAQKPSITPQESRKFAPVEAQGRRIDRGRKTMPTATPASASSDVAFISRAWRLTARAGRMRVRTGPKDPALRRRRSATTIWPAIRVQMLDR